MVLSRQVFTLKILYNRCPTGNSFLYLQPMSESDFLCSFTFHQEEFAWQVEITKIHSRLTKHRLKGKRSLITKTVSLFLASGGSFRGGNQSKVPSVIILPLGNLKKSTIRYELLNFHLLRFFQIQKRCEFLNRKDPSLDRLMITDFHFVCQVLRAKFRCSLGSCKRPGNELQHQQDFRKSHLHYQNLPKGTTFLTKIILKGETQYFTEEGVVKIYIHSV